jgi:hypothetical protein
MFDVAGTLKARPRTAAGILTKSSPHARRIPDAGIHFAAHGPGVKRCHIIRQIFDDLEIREPAESWTAQL